MKKETDIIQKDQRVSMNIALSPDDKRFLKVYAAEDDTTVAAVIAECIKRLRKEAGE